MYNNNSQGYRNKFTKLKTSKKRKPSSNKWLSRQLNDPFVAKSKIDGYRSRAAYKLLEIHNKFNIFKKGMKILDLGAAPGGWSQVARKLIGPDDDDVIIAIDMLDMDEIPGVIFLKKDFHEEDTNELILNTLNGQYLDIVLNDMAANTIGHRETDHLRIIDLCEKSLDFALKVLKPGGHFITKIFRGGAEINLLNKIKANFSKVKHFKPSSSRKESTELYLIALNKK